MSEEPRPGPLVCSRILGDRTDESFVGRRVDIVFVSAADASKRRLRLVSDSGRDVAVDLPRGSFLRDGAVLADDGQCIVAVSRTLEDAMLVTISGELDSAMRVAAALRIGHTFGSQHVPAEVVGDTLVVPITTSREVARRTLEALELAGVEAHFEKRALACLHPLAGHSHPAGAADSGHRH